MGFTPAELVVSLNSNDAQIYTRQGAEWVHTVTLSEVGPPCQSTAYRSLSSWTAARQADHLGRLGPELQPHRHCLAGQECVCLAGAGRSRDGQARVEADARAPENQQGGDVRQVES